MNLKHHNERNLTVVNVNSLYPSNYLKAPDLMGKTAKLKVRAVIMEKIGSDIKPVLYFQGKEKGMVLNKTNGMTIAQAYGPDTDAWIGGDIEIFSAYVDFQGKQVEGLRVRVPQRGAGVNVMPNARDRAMASQAPHANPPAPTEAYDNGFDDSVPF